MKKRNSKKKSLKRKKGRTSKTKLALAIAGGAMLGAGLTYANQNSILYSYPLIEKHRIFGFIKFDPEPKDLKYGLDGQKDQTSLAIYGSNNDTLWINIHGKGEDITKDAYFANSINKNKTKNIIMFRYPTYYGNNGHISRLSINQYIDSAVTEFKKQKPNISKINLIGNSMGCAMALNYAVDKDNIEKIVLYVPFSTLKDVIKKCAGPVCYIMSDNNSWDNLECAKKIMMKSKIPIINIFHGTSDKLIPIEQARLLNEAFGNNSTLHEIEDTHHDDIKPVVTMLMYSNEKYINLKNNIF